MKRLQIKRKIQSFFGFFVLLFKGIHHNKGVYVGKDVRFSTKNVIFGKDSLIRPHSSFFVISFICGSGCDIGEHNKFRGKIKMGNNVLIGPDNFVASNTHNYSNIKIPIISQGSSNGIEGENVVNINNGCWIGTHCAILGNVTIGCNSVIGANSVVTKDVPNFCVAVGNPAKIIKNTTLKRKTGKRLKMKILMLVNWKVKKCDSIPEDLQPADYFVKDRP